MEISTTATFDKLFIDLPKQPLKRQTFLKTTLFTLHCGLKNCIPSDIMFGVFV
jgi:hypothetical protein